MLHSLPGSNYTHNTRNAIDMDDTRNPYSCVPLTGPTFYSTFVRSPTHGPSLSELVQFVFCS